MRELHFDVTGQLLRRNKQCDFENIVRGSDKTPNGFQTRAGLIPQNHKGMIIFEEIGRAHV